MSQSLLTEIEQLKIIYKEIIDGYSYSDKLNIYIKHLTEIETIEVIKQRQFLFEKFKQEGLPTEAEKLQSLIETEQWSKDQEEELLQCRYIITDNQKLLSKIIPQQQGPIIKMIDQTKKKLLLLTAEKKALLGMTAEEISEREGFNYLVYLALYKDKTLKEKCFPSIKDLDESSDEEIDSFSRAFDRLLILFTEDNIKKIAALPFFINSFSYCKDNITLYLNKPIIELTPYQLLLFSLGNRNLSILTQTDAEPPELLDDVKIQDIVNWYDQQYSVILGKRKTRK